MAADYDINLARSAVHEAVGKLQSAQSYLNRAFYETAAATSGDIYELTRIIMRLERVNRRLLNHAEIALDRENRSRN